MIEMWDDCFVEQDEAVSSKLSDAPDEAFELMHKQLDKVWCRCHDVDSEE